MSLFEQLAKLLDQLYRMRIHLKIPKKSGDFSIQPLQRPERPLPVVGGFFPLLTQSRGPHTKEL